jgi:hypothetical protein
MSVMVNGNWGLLAPPIPDEPILNSGYEVLRRNGIRIKKEGLNVTGNNNSYNLNIFKLTGSVEIVSQYAIITAVTNLTNMTAVYADLWDGTNSVNLTSNGATLSGCPVGTLFTKDLDVTNPYTINKSDQCRMNEAIVMDIGKPFIITQKNGADTYVRLNYTTNTVLDFVMDVYFKFRELDGGTLEIV